MRGGAPARAPWCWSLEQGTAGAWGCLCVVRAARLLHTRTYSPLPLPVPDPVQLSVQSARRALFSS